MLDKHVKLRHLLRSLRTAGDTALLLAPCRSGLGFGAVCFEDTSPFLLTFRLEVLPVSILVQDATARGL